MPALLSEGAQGRAVVQLHHWLASLGYRVQLSETFDARTALAVEAYQRSAWLAPDRIVGAITWRALLSDVAGLGEASLAGFRGRLGFTAAREGHRGYPYWPGGASGVTLDPGFDVSRNTEARLVHVYGGLIRAQQLALLSATRRLRGEVARSRVREPDLLAIRIDTDAAAIRMPTIAGPLWRECAAGCRRLLDPLTPAAVHTVLLSLAYNAGSDDVLRLRETVAAGAWAQLADQLGAMHASQPALARRRRAEAQLLRSALREGANPVAAV